MDFRHGYEGPALPDVKFRRVISLLGQLRQEAGLTQREIGKRLGKPQSWVHNCETANRRVDITEFISWCKACGIDPMDGLKRLLDELG